MKRSRTKEVVLIMSTIIILICMAMPISVSAETTTKTTTVSVSVQTSENTDKEPLSSANIQDEGTPTFYYILGGVAVIFMIFAVIGGIKSKKDKNMIKK